jgi:hypothetical protein
VIHIFVPKACSPALLLSLKDARHQSTSLFETTKNQAAEKLNSISPDNYNSPLASTLETVPFNTTVVDNNGMQVPDFIGRFCERMLLEYWGGYFKVSEDFRIRAIISLNVQGSSDYIQS